MGKGERLTGRVGRKRMRGLGEKESGERERERCGEKEMWEREREEKERRWGEKGGERERVGR